MGVVYPGAGEAWLRPVPGSTILAFRTTVVTESSPPSASARSAHRSECLGHCHFWEEDTALRGEATCPKLPSTSVLGWMWSCVSSARVGCSKPTKLPCRGALDHPGPGKRRRGVGRASAQGCGQCNRSWLALGSVNNALGRTRLPAQKAGQGETISVQLQQGLVRPHARELEEQKLGMGQAWP